MDSVVVAQVGVPTYYDCDQRSPEWFEARRKADCTATTVVQLYGVGYGSGVSALKALAGLPSSKAPLSERTLMLMQQGVDGEPHVLNAIQSAFILTHYLVPVGFCTRDILPAAGYDNDERGGAFTIGASPDGLLVDKRTGEITCVEVKVREASNRVYIAQDDWWRFVVQLQVQMLCAGAARGLLAIACRGEIRLYDVPFSNEFIRGALLGPMRATMTLARAFRRGGASPPRTFSLRACLGYHLAQEMGFTERDELLYMPVTCDDARCGADDDDDDELEE